FILDNYRICHGVSHSLTVSGDTDDHNTNEPHNEPSQHKNIGADPDKITLKDPTGKHLPQTGSFSQGRNHPNTNNVLPQTLPVGKVFNNRIVQNPGQFYQQQPEEGKVIHALGEGVVESKKHNHNEEINREGRKIDQCRQDPVSRSCQFIFYLNVLC